MNAKLSAAAGRFHCMFVLCNRFVLSVNSALYLQHHANVVCYISENKVNHRLLPDKGIHYPFPRGLRSGLLKCVCGVATLQKGRVCSDVLTRTRPTSKLMNKLSLHVFSFS